MADLTYQEAIAELNRLKSIAGGPPTVAELQSIVSRTRVTLADTGLAADRAGVVRGAVLYSGVANSQVRTNDLAKALYQLDPSIAIIDETHIGKLLAGATFGNEALAAILRENPSFTVVQARDFINGTNGGFWSSASERFAAANANGKLVALVPNPTGFDPSRIFGSNEMKALMQGSGTGSINGIPLSELRLRYSALAPAGAAGALEDIAQIVSVKSLSDSWANISVDTSVSGSAPPGTFQFDIL